MRISFFISLLIHAGVLAFLLFGDRHCCHPHIITPMAVELVADSGRSKISVSARPKDKVERKKLPQPVQPEAKPAPIVEPGPSLERKVVQVSENPAATSSETGESSGASAADHHPIEGVTSVDEVSHYLSSLIGVLNQNKLYPREALEREEEGVVTIGVTVDTDGATRDWRVEIPCPFESLNRAALLTIQRARRFPPLPRGVVAPARFHIPIKFEIRS